MKKILKKERFGFLDIPFKHVYWINPFKQWADFEKDRIAYWIKPFDNKEEYVIIEYKIDADNYKITHKTKDETKTFESEFKGVIEATYKNIVNESDNNPQMTWQEFNKNYSIQIQAISTYELETNDDSKNFRCYFVDTTENTSFEIIEKETGDTVEELSPIYEDEERKYMIQDLFNIYHTEAIKKEKEEIFNNHIKKEV